MPDPVQTTKSNAIGDAALSPAVLQAAGTKHENANRWRRQPIARDSGCSTEPRMMAGWSCTMDMHEPLRAVAEEGVPMAASFFTKLATLFTLPIRVITIFRSLFPNGEIASKHERWDEEQREVGRCHG
jgi:hypothetical protein